MDEVYIDIRKENRWITQYFPNKDFVSIYDLMECIENLDYEIKNWKEKYEELERDLEDNYKPISHWEEYGISENDFH